MIDCVNAFYEGMVTRSEEMKLHPNYRTGENYAYLGLAPQFLIFDEYVAFLEMLTTKESTALLSQLKKIVMLGRQAGYFLIVACKRLSAKSCIHSVSFSAIPPLRKNCDIFYPMSQQ